MSFVPDTPLAGRVAPSPNHDARTVGRPDILLLHYTGMANPEAALAQLRAPASKVSCHYFVGEDGEIIQLVPEARRAWHAGVASWEGTSDINSRSIGVEIVNPGHGIDYRDFPPAQIDAVIALCCSILARHAIRPDRVLAHSDVAPTRKNDPGEKFPWRGLAAAGVGLWIEPSPIAPGPMLGLGDRGPAVVVLQTDLSAYGYGVGATGVFDQETRAAVTALQRHFRPARVDGIADRSTLDTLARLCAARRRMAEGDNRP